MADQQKQGYTGVTLLKGAAVLGAAAVISKLLGTMQKIPLQNIAGDEVFGVYNAVYPLYILILTLATAGLPLAVSKFVAEHVALGQYREAKRIFHIASLVLLAMGILFFSLLFFTADWLAWLIGIKASAKAIRYVSFALLLVPVMAALRGYFQGMQNMLPTAVSQVAEQFIRVTTMVVLLLYFTRWGYDTGTIAAGAAFGSVTGAAVGLMVMVYYWRQARAGAIPDLLQNRVKRESASFIIKQFMRYALPICLGSIVMPLLTLVDTFTMPRLLKRSLDEISATHLFGIYNHGLPLVQLVAMIATSMSAALVPSIAEAKMHRQQHTIHTRTELALRFTWLVGLAASFGLAATAIPLNVMFYKSAEGWQAMAILAFTAVFSAVNIVSASILQGFGAVMAPVRNLFIAVLLKIVFNLLLIPYYGIEGAAISAVIAFAAACFLNLRDLRKSVQAGNTIKQFLRPLAALLIMCAVLWICIYGLGSLFAHLPVHFSYRLQNTIVALFSVLLAALVYMIALIRLGAVSKQELAGMPGFNSKVLPILSKLRLLH